MDKTEETELLQRNDLLFIRKKKLQDEIQSAIRIIKKKIEPLEIADKFITDTFEIMKDGISRNYPELSESNIHQKVRDLLSLARKIQILQKRGKDLG
ncbi:MAG: hypothetical protein EU529_01085 [Promethearchaeota archaeon]|nr:MAG: hypothetical protein EU529_01085 [Candidatus Lokiarchaeota archaeon]